MAIVPFLFGAWLIPGAIASGNGADLPLFFGVEAAKRDEEPEWQDGAVATQRSGADAPAAPQPDFVLDLPVSVGGRYVRDLAIGVSGDGTAFIKADDLRALLTEAVKADFIAGLALPSGDVLLTDRSVRDAGLPMRYDSGALAVFIDPPFTERLSEKRSLRSGLPKQTANTEQSGVAAGVSVTVNPAYVHQGRTTGFAPVRARAAGFANVGGASGLNLDWRGRYTEGADDPFALTDVLLFKDFYDRAVRVGAGTLRPRSSGRFSRPTSVIGFGIFTDYASIRPLTNLRPDGAASFTLEEESLVTVSVNGAVAFAERFDAGAYDLADLPLTPGNNDVVVSVENAAGSQDLAVFSTFVDNQLLARGVSRFAVTAGVPRVSGGAVPQGGDGFAYNLAYDRGLTGQLTAGAAVEGIDEDWTAIGTAAIGLPIGIVSIEAGAQSDADGFAAAGLARFAWQSDPTRPISQNLNVQVGYTQGGFGALSRTGDRRFALRRPADAYEANVRYGLRLPVVALSSSLQYQFDGDADRYVATVSAARTIGAYSLSLNVRYRHEEDGFGQVDSEEAIVFSLSRRLDRSTRVRTSYDTQGRTVQAQALRFDGRAVGDWDARLLLNDDERSESLDAAAGIILNRGEFDIGFRASRADGIETATSTASIAFGVGVADGKVGFGRPFRDGFAVVAPHGSLGDRRVSLTRGEGEVVAESGRLGPALLPLRGPYRIERTTIGVQELPVGYDIGSGQIVTFAGAKAGYGITVGSGAASTVMGTLLLPDGAPMALAVGSLVGDGADEPAAFFTNRTGRFVAEGLKAGVYNITLKPDDRIVGQVTVEEGTGGLVRVGKVTMTSR